MNNLEKFQKDFLMDIIVGGRETVELLKPAGELSANDCLSVYRGDYFARLTDALGETFEATWSILGDEDFYELTKIYIKENPSISFDLGKYGKSFPDFLSKKMNDSDLDFLSELSFFEWSFWDYFHKGGELPRDTFPQEQSAIFSLDLFEKDFLLFSSQVDLYLIWKNRENVEFFSQVSLDEIMQTTFLYLGRGKDGVFYGNVTREEYFLLRELKNGKPLKAAIESISEIELWSPENWCQFFKKFKLLYECTTMASAMGN